MYYPYQIAGDGQNHHLHEQTPAKLTQSADMCNAANASCRAKSATLLWTMPQLFLRPYRGRRDLPYKATKSCKGMIPPSFGRRRHCSVRRLPRLPGNCRAPSGILRALRRRAAYKVADAHSIGVSCDLSLDRLSPAITTRVTSERKMHKATIASGADDLRLAADP